MMNYSGRIVREELFRKKPGMPELYYPASPLVFIQTVF